MSFISKLSQFTEGFARGAPLGAQIGGTLAASKTRVANLDEKKVQDLFDSGGRAEAVQMARDQGQDNLAHRLSMQLTAQDRVELEDMSRQLTSATAGLATQMEGADLTTEKGRMDARGVLSSGAPILSADATGLETRRTQLGVTGDATDAALTASRGFIEQAGAQIGGIDNLDTEIQGLMVHLTATPEEIEAQLGRIELAYKQAGGAEEDFYMLEDSLKRGLQSARDSVFTKTILPNIKDANFLRRLALDYSVSPGIDGLADSMANTLEKDADENVSERERSAAQEARHLMSLARTVGQTDPTAGLAYLELAAQTYESDPLNNSAMADSIRKNKHAFIISSASMDKRDWIKWAVRLLVTDKTAFHSMLGKVDDKGNIDFTQNTTVEELHTLSNILFQTTEDVSNKTNVSQSMAKELNRVANLNDEKEMKSISNKFNEELKKDSDLGNAISQDLRKEGWTFDEDLGVFVFTQPYYIRRPPPISSAQGTAPGQFVHRPDSATPLPGAAPVDSAGQAWWNQLSGSKAPSVQRRLRE